MAKRKKDTPEHYSTIRKVLDVKNDQLYAEEVAIMEHYFNKHANPEVAAEKYWDYILSSEPAPPILVQKRHKDVAAGKKSEEDLGISLL